MTNLVDKGGAADVIYFEFNKAFFPASHTILTGKLYVVYAT